MEECRPSCPESVLIRRRKAKGDGLGGRTEEVWTAPDGGVMLGMFRLLRNDKPAFYELLIITDTPRGLAMRLKHFNPDMTAWEEKEKFIEFRYVRTSGDEAPLKAKGIRRGSAFRLSPFAFHTSMAPPISSR